jgi:hypothetical protein
MPADHPLYCTLNFTYRPCYVILITKDIK